MVAVATAGVWWGLWCAVLTTAVVSVSLRFPTSSAAKSARDPFDAPPTQPLSSLSSSSLSSSSLSTSSSTRETKEVLYFSLDKPIPHSALASKAKDPLEVDSIGMQGSNIAEDETSGIVESSRLKKKKRYIVLHLTSLGLANRLRTIADFHTIALYSHRTLLLSWVPSIDCNVSFLELFQSGPEHFKVLPHPLKKDHSLAKEQVQMLAKKSELTVAEYDPTGDTTFFAASEMFDSDVNVVFTIFWGSTALKRLPCHHFMISRSKFYQSLVPVSAVRTSVEDVKKKFMGKIMIGVHVRKFDADYDWAVVPPLSPSDPRATTFGATLSLDEFIQQMRLMESKFTVKTTKTSAESLAFADEGIHTHKSASFDTFESHRFFIASNDYKVKEKMRSEFPTSISVSGSGTNSLNRSSPDGMFIALVEWLILAQSDIIIHTYGSSYAMEASQVFRRPLVGLWTKDLAIYHEDERLLLCGNFQFMKEFGSGSIDVQFEEGTADRRKIKSKAILLRRCKTLLDWGIENIYCITSDDND